MQKNRMQLKGSTVVITGAARRVGRQVATRLAESGANIVVNYRTSAAEAEEAVRELNSLGVGSLAVHADVSTRCGVQVLLEAALAEFETVEVLIYESIPFDELDEDDFDRNISVNLKGPYLGCWLFGQHMREQGRGKIVNFADWAVERPYVDYAPYFVAKGGIVALTRVMAKELAPHVHVNAIAPGPILLPDYFDRDMIREVERATPLGRIGDPEDIAQTIRYLIEGTDFVTGVVIPVDGGRTVS